MRTLVNNKLYRLGTCASRVFRQEKPLKLYVRPTMRYMVPEPDRSVRLESLTYGKLSHYAHPRFDEPAGPASALTFPASSLAEVSSSA